MFPTIIESSENETQSIREKVISTGRDIRKTPNIDFSQKNTCISRMDRVYFCCSRVDQGTTMAYTRVRAGGCRLPSG